MKSVQIPVLAVTAGPPGAGKTTLAMALGRILGWRVIDRDVLKSQVLDAGVTDNSVAAALADDRLLTLGRQILAQGMSVILNGHGVYPRFVTGAIESAQRAAAKVKVLFLNAPGAIRNARMSSRLCLRSQTKFDPRSDKEVDALFGHLPADTLRLDTTQPFAVTVEAALEYLRA